MQFKIIITTKKLEVAEELHKLIEESKIYNGHEIVMLSGIKEVCEECAKR